MTNIADKFTINAPADKVWETLKGFGNVEQYLPMVQNTMLEGSGVGAIRTCTSTMQDGSTTKIVERLESIDEAQKTLKIAIVEGPIPAENCLVTIKVNPLETNRAELEFTTSLQPKGITEEEVHAMFLPVFKMAAQGLEKLHHN